MIGPTRFRPTESLAVRVIGLSSLWAIAAFLVVGTLISSLYERTAQSGFQAVVRAQLFNLINAVTVNEDGGLVGVPDLGDLEYSQPLSGWYWEVLPASANTEGRLSSFSLGPGRIEAPNERERPFDGQYRRDYRTTGLNGETLYVEEAEVVLDGDNHAARFRVMGNASVVDGDVAAFNRRLGLYLGVFGLGSIVINALAILTGLHPLIGVRRSLAEVREGRADRLPGSFPAEIRPLATEMNLLIDSNRRIVERARTQVGNLAHSLKTPIAVLRNEADAIGGERGRLVAEQTEAMRVQVQHYLDRARVAALGGLAVARTPALPVLERSMRVIARLSPGSRVELDADGAGRAVFAGEAQDLEEIVGNLLENAAKYGRSRIRAELRLPDDDHLLIAIEDDGAGLSERERAEALRRGARLDERVAGSGLGLSIVTDTVLQYRGDFRLAKAEIGGLRAEVVLPRAPDTPMS
ncbi:ATP-binding protein [Aureimonas jatrophae]|uniref:histidine kinase n=1 Tax=Aureimonas jatrophae TaxID=1166073 RepID=A0A1H0CQV9_9HYPH|nr:HAMP domain-containing sensor histidine kinase [Aureimonas jatrophae]MBB3949343.1 signal transduction histidine kinase [Aureimonas jatrophae]SDN60226.1 Signal transduction histidine kinase [Aureimonas jatrophae]